MVFELFVDFVELFVEVDRLRNFWISAIKLNGGRMNWLLE